MRAVLRSDIFTANLSTAARVAPLNAYLDSLREIAVTLLTELDSLNRPAPKISAEPVDLKDAVQRFEILLITATLERTQGNQSRAARLLGVKHTTLNAKVRRYGIQVAFADSSIPS